ncbi:MAG: AMP-binding protein [Chloroflexi bacterium]|nr:AMP-binding protein [Chloroflexota bacterium]
MTLEAQGDFPKIDVEQTLYQAVRSVAEQFPEREALVIGDERLTYRQLMERLDALAAGLQGLGVQRGERVGVILPTCLESAALLLAPGKFGAVTVPMNPMLRGHEVRHILADSGAVALVTVAEMYGHDYLKMIAAIRPTLPALRYVIVKGAAGGDGIIPLDDLYKPSAAPALPAGEVQAGDPAYLIYTSGTTGQPKGAVHTHETMLRSTDSILQVVDRSLLQCFLSPFPLFHVAGLMIGLATYVVGGKMVLMERFHPQQALNLIEKERVTLFGGVPTILQTILGVPDLAKYDVSSLRTAGSGAAMVPPALIRGLKARLGCDTLIAYGITETSWLSITTPADPEYARLETVGRPIPNVEIRIVDDDRRDLPLGQVGEIACRAPFIMKGYHNRPQQTAEVLDQDGWYYTGDIGSVDELGFIRILDRKKDMIIRGGINVYPAEVESFLLTHPGVLIAAVVGVSSAVGGERLRAYIIPKPGVTLTEAQVLDHCRGRIAAYKIPDEVRLVAELPMTATGKVQRFALREQAFKEMAPA